MFGKGMFVWKIKNCSGGNVALIAEQAAALKLNYLAVKINRGYCSYNWRKNAAGIWVDDYIPALRDALSLKGIELYGWGDVWLLNGRMEAQKVIDTMEKYGLAGYFVDAEAQAKQSKNRYAEAERYAEVLGDLAVPVLLCSYRYPSAHPELPWDELLNCCTHHAPQVYWIHGKNPALQLTQSIAELREKKDLPFVPAGPAFDEHGWHPTIAEVNEFNQACMDQGCEGVIWWEYDEADDNGYFPIIQSHDWPSSPTPPPTQLTNDEMTLTLWAHHPELWGLV